MRVIDRVSDALRVGRRFWPELREHRGQLALLTVTSLLAVGFEILRPWPIQWIFDGALAVPEGAEPKQSAFVIVSVGAAAALAIALSRTALEYFSTLKLAAVGHSVTRSLRLRIYGHMAELSPFFHSKHRSGDLLMRLMGDVPMLRTMLVDASVAMLSRSALIVGTVAVMLVVDPLLTVLTLVPLPALFFVVRFFSKRLTIAVRKQRKKEGELADYLQEAIGATTLLQSLGNSQHAVRRFARRNRRSVRAGLKAARTAARLAASVEALLGTMVITTLAAGAWRVTTNHLTPGELLVFLSYVRSLMKPARSATKNMARVAGGTACGERILEVLDQVVEVRETAGDRLAPARPSSLVFERCSYRYPNDTPAIHAVDLRFRPGELVALFGHSGAGKTTLASLALRLFDPTEGSVRLDGHDLREYDLDSLRSSFALVMQDTVLFGESLRENLLFGRPDANDEDLMESLVAAGAGGFVSRLPDGLDTVLGSNGVGLSGGESRRICLARTLLRGAPILIADEPFRGLDAEVADEVAANLRACATDRMVLVITHEADRLGDFDRVVRIRHGRVVADERQSADTPLIAAHQRVSPR